MKFSTVRLLNAVQITSEITLYKGDLAVIRTNQNNLHEYIPEGIHFIVPIMKYFKEEDFKVIEEYEGIIETITVITVKKV